MSERLGAAGRAGLDAADNTIVHISHQGDMRYEEQFIPNARAVLAALGVEWDGVTYEWRVDRSSVGAGWTPDGALTEAMACAVDLPRQRRPKLTVAWENCEPQEVAPDE